jgi:hypothetical protein
MKLYSPGDLALACGVPTHRVQYVLRSRPGRYAPVGAPGRTRVYGAAALAQMRADLAETAGGRWGSRRT